MQPIRFFRDEENVVYTVPESDLTTFESGMAGMPYKPVTQFRDAEGVDYFVANDEHERFKTGMSGMPYETIGGYRSTNGKKYLVPESGRAKWAEELATLPEFQGDRTELKQRVQAAKESVAAANQSVGSARAANRNAQAMEASMPFLEKAGLFLTSTGKNLPRALGQTVESIVEHGLKGASWVFGVADSAATAIDNAMGGGHITDAEGNPRDSHFKKAADILRREGERAAQTREHPLLAYQGEEVGAHVLPQLLSTVGESLYWAAATGGTGLMAQGASANAAAQTGLRALAPKIGRQLMQGGRVASVYGLSTASDITTEAREQGRDELTAQGLGLLAGTIEAVLEGLSNVAGLQKQAKGILRGTVAKHVLDFALNAIGEGVTESLQELSTETIRKLSGLSDAQWESIFEQVLISGAYGFGASVLGEGIGRGANRIQRSRLNKALKANGLAVDEKGSIVPDPAALPEDATGINPENGDVTYKDGTVTHRDGTATTADGITLDHDGNIVVPKTEAEAETGEAFDFFDAIQKGEVSTLEVPVDSIAVNDRIPQFKGDADPVSGVVYGQELSGTFKRLPVKPIVVLQFDDGKMEVVTGRHRLDLARRNGEAVIPAAIVKESEGWSVERARLLDAYDNIIDEKGSVQDYIRFFEGSTLDEVTAREEGLLSRKDSKNAWAIAREATPDIRSAALAGKKDFPPDVAASIARHAPLSSGGKAAEGIQRAAHREVLRAHLDADEAAILTSTMMHDFRLLQQQAFQDDLFGADDTAMQVMAAKARIAGDHRRALEKVRTRLSAALTKKGDLELTQSFAESIGIKDRTSREEVQAALEQVKAEHERWQKYFNHPDLLERVDREVDARFSPRPNGAVDPLNTTPIETENGTLTDAATLKRELDPAAENLDEPGDMLFNPGRFTKHEIIIPNTRIKGNEVVEVLKKLQGKELKNDETGITAQISGVQRRKLVSRKAVDKSIANGFTVSQHNHTVANIETIYRHASLYEVQRDRLNDPNIASIKRFTSGITLADKDSTTPGTKATAYITLKESIRDGNRIYSLELMELKKPEDRAGRPLTAARSSHSSGSSEAGQRDTADERLSVDKHSRAPSSETSLVADHLTISRADKSAPGVSRISALNDNGIVTSSGEEVNPPGDRLNSPAKGGPIEKAINRKKTNRDAISVNGVRILPHNAYDNQTDSAQHTLQGGAAASHGRVLPMPQSALVMLYEAITKKLPQVRQNTGRAMGWYQLNDGQIVLNAVNFGLIDRSDAKALSEKVAEKYGQNWEEKPEANKLFDRLLHSLLKARSRQPQVRAPRVLAHEIGHMIDYIEDGKVARGNLIGHLKRLKRFTDQTLGALEIKELRAQSKDLITWWRGADEFEAYFAKPTEMYAELFGIYLADPGAMEQRAPMLYNALTGALDQHPEIKKTWQHIQNLMNTGSEYTASLLDRLTEGWSAEEQTKAGRFEEEATKDRAGQKREALHYFFTDRFGAISAVAVDRAAKNKIKQLDKALTDALIGQEAYDKQTAKIKAEADRIKAAVKQYIHRDNLMRLVLADVNGSVMRVLKQNNLEWKTLALYAHMNRVIELQGRATAAGIEPAEAHAILTDMKENLGPERFSALETAWNNFRGTYEKYVINDPDVQAMYGSETIAMMRRNTHYVTMQHRKSVAEIDAMIAAHQKWKETHPGEAEPLDMLLEFAVAGKGDKVGHKIHTLKGSFKYTEEPLTATLRKANAIITAAKKNAVVSMLSDFFSETGYDQYAPAKATMAGIEKLNRGPLRTVTFMRDGKLHGMHISKWIEKAINYQAPYLGAFGKTARWITSFFTTNNPAFLEPAYMKDKQAVVKLIKGLYRSPLNSIPIIGETLGLFTRYIPPTTMKYMPRWLFNPHTLEYYEASARRAAQMIQKGNFAENLERAAILRQEGKTTAAEAIEYEVHIARWMLEKGSILSTNTSISHEYTEPDITRLMNQYGIDIDGIDPDMTSKQKALTRLRKGIDAYKNLSEIREFTTKIITAMYLDQVRHDLTDAQKVKLITEHGGSPDFNQRGAAATLIEFFLQPFWNARQKGFIRTFQAAKDHPGDWILKQSLYTLFPATVTWMLAHGALSNLIRKYFDDDEDKMRQTPIGKVVDWLDDLHARYRNVGRYFSEKYLTIPLPYGDPQTGASLCLTIPLDDESVSLRMFTNHALNTYGPALFPGTTPRANPNAMTDISREIIENIIPDLQSKGALIGLINPFIQTFALGQNPYDTFRGRTLLSDDEFTARWLTPHATGTLVKEMWNTLPTGIAYRFKDKTAESPAGADDGLLQFLNQPFIQPIFGRYIRFIHGGRDESLRALHQLNEEKQAPLRLQAKDDYLRYKKNGYFDAPTTERMRTDAYYYQAFRNEMRKDATHTQKLNGFSLDEIKRIRSLHPEFRQKGYETLNQ